MRHPPAEIAAHVTPSASSTVYSLLTVYNQSYLDIIDGMARSFAVMSLLFQAHCPYMGQRCYGPVIICKRASKLQSVPHSVLIRLKASVGQLCKILLYILNVICSNFRQFIVLSASLYRKPQQFQLQNIRTRNWCPSKGHSFAIQMRSYLVWFDVCTYVFLNIFVNVCAWFGTYDNTCSSTPDDNECLFKEATRRTLSIPSITSRKAITRWRYFRFQRV